MPDYDDGYDESSYVEHGNVIIYLIVIGIIFFVFLGLLDLIGRKLNIKFIKFLPKAVFENGENAVILFLFLISMFLAWSEWLMLAYVLMLGCLFWGLETWRMIELDEGNERHISYGAIAVCGIIGLLFISFAR